MFPEGDDAMEISKKKTKNSIMKFVFGRTGFIILLLLIQIGVIFVGIDVLGDRFPYLMGILTFISMVVVVYIINRNDNPAYKLAWMLPVLIFPVFGGLFYLFVRLNLPSIAIKNRIWTIELKTRPIIDSDDSFLQCIEENKPHLSRLGKYINSITGMHIYRDSNIKYYPLGEDKFKDLVDCIEKAEKFIFLEYFIIEEGYMWNTILDILEKKVQQGVEVRVMYDGLGTLTKLPYNYDRKLREMGIKTKIFLPVAPVLSTIQNNRDHRKIFVIDGKYAFNGGVNLADEYINKKMVFGHWKDSAVMVTGEAVQSYTLMFLQMWNIDEKQPEDYKKYILASQEEHGEGYICAFYDNPLISDRVGKTVYLDMLNTAKEYVHITTPYFLPDNEILSAMITAAKSGIDVKMIIPHIPDKKIPFIMARSYYQLLIESGVKVYEYKPGFIHAKNFVSDGKRAVVGTINLDFRSLYLHFECGTYFEDCKAVADVEDDFCDTLKKCIPVTYQYLNTIPFWENTLGRFLRVFAPLM
jgi:cardiolipin synthase